MAAESADRPTADTRLLSMLSRHKHAHFGARRLMQYLKGERHRGQVNIKEDVLPALTLLEGDVALEYVHDGGTNARVEYVYPAKEHDAVSSCWYVRKPDQTKHTAERDAQITNTPWNADELDAAREVPPPDRFVFVAEIDYSTPTKALGGRE